MLVGISALRGYLVLFGASCVYLSSQGGKEMKRPIVAFAVASGLAVIAAAQILPKAALQAAEMQMKPPLNVEDIKWGPAPPLIPPGAQFAVVAGDPGKEGLFTIRLKMPANYKVPAHHHPTDEFVTVISGDFRVGLGDKLDMNKGQSLKAGAFGEMPAGMNHYAWTTEETVVQIAGPGPFAVIYANPADDPSKQATK